MDAFGIRVYLKPTTYSRPEEYGEEVEDEVPPYPGVGFELGLEADNPEAFRDLLYFEEQQENFLAQISAQPCNGIKIMEKDLDRVHRIDRSVRDQILTRVEEEIDRFFENANISFPVEDMDPGRYRLPETFTSEVTEGNLPHPEEPYVDIRKYLESPTSCEGMIQR